LSCEKNREESCRGFLYPGNGRLRRANHHEVSPIVALSRVLLLISRRWRATIDMRRMQGREQPLARDKSENFAKSSRVSSSTLKNSTSVFLPSLRLLLAWRFNDGVIKFLSIALPRVNDHYSLKIYSALPLGCTVARISIRDNGTS